MFKEYGVTINFRNQFAAGIPKDPEALLKFLEVRAPERKPEDAIPLEEMAEEIAEHLPAAEDAQAAITTTFKMVDGCLVYEARNIKAHIKDCASILSKGVEKVRGLKSAVANRIQVEPDYIPLMKEGKPVVAVDGKEIRPITIMSRQGPRTAVKIVEFVNAPTLVFRLVTLDDKVVTKKLLEDIFTYGGRIKGMGQDRGLGWGRYSATIQE